MNWTIVVGVLISLMFLVAFTQWFYLLANSINEVVDQDIYYKSNIVKWVVGSVVFMAGMFWVLAYINECPNPDEKTGIFQYMDCRPYHFVRGGLEDRGLVAPYTPAEESDEFFEQR